jgi:hypothetical protein
VSIEVTVHRFNVQRSALPPAKKTAGLIEEEIIKKRILNVEGMYSVYLRMLIAYFKNKEFLYIFNMQS